MTPLVKALLEMSWRSLLLRVIDFVVGSYLTLIVFNGFVYFATEHDVFDASRAMALFVVVWSIGALLERRRS